MSLPISFDVVLEKFQENNYTVLNPLDYKGVHCKLKVRCIVGHESEVFVNNVIYHNKKCKKCAGKINGERCRRSESEIKECLAVEGYSLESNYITNKRPILVQCPNGHLWKTYWNKFKIGKRCSIDRCRKRVGRPCTDVSAVISLIGKEKYEILDGLDNFKGFHSKLSLLCPEKHVWTVSFGNFYNGRRCKECHKFRIKLSKSEVVESIEKEGYTIINGLENYVDSSTRLTVQCDKKHTPYEVTVNNFRNSKRCPGCGSNYSKGQSEVFEFIKLFDPEVKINDRTVICPLELDVYSDKYKLAIEYNGLFWHAERFRLRRKEIDQNCHRKKLELCREKGVRLLQFWEDEWRDKQDVVKSMIVGAIGQVSNKVYARDCSVVSVTKNLRKDFLDKNHLQGDTSSSVCFGLIYNNDLVQVLSLRKMQYTGGTSHWEVARMATKLNTVVIGGLSKLTGWAKDWVITQGGQELYSFVDLRFGVGTGWLKAGFEKTEETLPGYWYTNFHIRKHRYGLRKTTGCPEGMTEVQWRNSQGWYRLFDCGQLKLKIKCGNLNV